MTTHAQPDDARLEALIAIPGEDAGGVLALVVRGEPSARLASALRHGIDTLCVVPAGGAPRPIREAAGRELAEAGPDALVAAAAALRARASSALGSAEPLPGGGYAAETAAAPVAEPLTPGLVGAALALDPEFIADTGRAPLMVHIGTDVMVVPVEDRECVEEARPAPDVLRRVAPGRDPALIVLVVTGPRGTPLPDPVPATVFRGGDWPRPLAASVSGATAIGALEGVLGETARRVVVFTPAREGAGASPATLPTMTIERTGTGAVRVTTAARRLL